MKNQGLNKLFMNELKDMYSSENQIIKALPNFIKLATSNELKEALNKHLKETERQVTRVKKIFSLLGVTPTEETCEGMRGIIAEGNEMVTSDPKSPTLDAAIIAACQKIEHYEIATYGTLKNFAKQLDLDSEVVDLVDEILDEEVAADKQLTKIAQGTLFTTGVNQQAAQTGNPNRPRR